MSNQPNMLEAARRYVEDGFSVIPICWPTPDGRCGCGGGHTGKQIGKAPLIKSWRKMAAREAQRVNELWGERPNANIGILTDGLVVLDIDKDNGGFDSKATIEERYGPLLRTRKHRTGGGGEQWIYSNPDGTEIKNAVKLGGYDGIDLRANGGQIVAPPSLHRSGNRYKVLDDAEIAPVPD
ncbi:bifunctional DNA primase/polymerase [Chloroflexota bacterium]